MGLWVRCQSPAWTKLLRSLARTGSGRTGWCVGVSEPGESLPGGNSVKMFSFNTSGFLPNQKRKKILTSGMKEVLGFSVNGTQSLMDPGFFVAQVKLQREKWRLGVRRTFALGWALGKLLSLENS